MLLHPPTPAQEGSLTPAAMPRVMCIDSVECGHWCCAALPSRAAERSNEIDHGALCNLVCFYAAPSPVTSLLANLPTINHSQVAA